MKLSDIKLHDIGNAIQMTGVVYSGNGYTYLVMFPEDQASLHIGHRTIMLGGDDVATLDMDLEEWQKFIYQTDVMETEVLSKASNGELAKVVLRKSTRNIEQSISWAVFRRDLYACRYCGKDNVPLTVDHIICWESGGPSTMENLLAVCRKCNRIRGNTPYADWLSGDEYAKISKGLSVPEKRNNEFILSKLDSIPLRIHQRSR